jgi:Tfp pilus assembly protein PilO
MKKNNSAAMAVLTVLIVVGCFVFIWKFILPDYTIKQQQIAQGNIDIENAQAKFDSLNKTKVTLGQLGDLVNQMLVAVPSDKDAPNLITELEAIAAKNNTTIPSINIASVSGPTALTVSTTASGASSVGVSFAVCGSFDDMHSMMAALENDLRFMDIQNVTLTQEAADSSSGSTGGDSCAGKLSTAVQLQAFERTSASAASASVTPGT